MDTYSISHYQLGPMANLIYLVHDHASGRAAVVDPAWDVAAILAGAESCGAQITDVLLTHSHADHVNALDELRTHCDLTVHLSAPEAAFWSGAPKDAILHEDGDKIALGQTQIEWLLTPGHTPGSSCMRVGDNLIAGDTLFVFGCGRCDLPGGDAGTMFRTIQALKKRVPPEVTVLPGHDYAIVPSASMAMQCESNPFFHLDEEAAFIHYRMHLHSRVRATPYEPVTRASVEQLTR